MRAALADGVLAPNTPVWRRGWSDWKPANEVSELMPAGSPAAPGQQSDVPPPPPFVVAAQAAFEGASAGEAPGPEEPPAPPKWVPAPIAAGAPAAPAKPRGDRVPGKSLPPPLPKKKGAASAPPAAGTKAHTMLGLAPAAQPGPADPGPAPAPAAGTKAHTLLGLAPVAQPGPTDAEPAPGPELESPLGPPRARRGGLSDALRRALERPAWQLAAAGVALALVLLGLAGLVLRLVRGQPVAPPAPVASASAPQPAVPSASAVASGAASGVASAVASTPVAEPFACRVTGDAQLIAPKALVASGVEVVALAAAMEVGFAEAPKEARVATLNLADAAPSRTRKVKATGTIRRVTPLGGGRVALDVDRAGDRIQGRRAAGPFDAGVADHALVLGAHGKDQTQKLWSLETDAPVDALRGVAFGEGVAIAYRHASAVWVGAAKGDRSAVSPPTRVAGLGSQLGAPAIAAASGTVLVAWADRAQASDAWGLRLLSWRPGEAASPARAFELPPDGPGHDAMSPGLAPLAKEKFLLVWTEGPAAHHQVRAQVLAPGGTPAGAAFVVSAQGLDAGQAQAAVGADGRGAVAFLAASGTSFDVRAAPILCQ